MLICSVQNTYPSTCESLELSHNHPSLYAAQLESSCAERDLEVLVDTKLTISQQMCLCHKNRPVVSWTALGEELQVKRGDPFPLLSTGQATPGVLCPVLGSPV